MVNKIKIRLSILMLSLITIISIMTISISGEVKKISAASEDYKDKLIRFHVIANSDSEEDQNLKLKVRDELLSYMNIISKDSTSKQEAMQIANEHKEEFTQIAEKVIKENGYNYTVNVQIGKADFPTKYYGDITLPAGTYDALKVQIGEAKGQNWWCVMFPPLCFVDVSTGIVPDNSKQELKQSLDNEEYDLISKTDNNEISFKFKIVELFQNWRLGNK